MEQTTQPAVEIGQLRFVAGRGIMRVMEKYATGVIRMYTHDGCSYYAGPEQVRSIPTEEEIARYTEQHVSRGMWPRDYTPTWRQEE